MIRMGVILFPSHLHLNLSSLLSLALFLQILSPSSLQSASQHETFIIFIVWTLRNGSAEDSGIRLAFCVHHLCVYVRVYKYGAVRIHLLKQHAPKKALLYGGEGVASMSLYEKLQKGVLVEPAFTQDPKGSRGSSGSRGSKTSETGRNTETEEEKQRWVEMGRR